MNTFGDQTMCPGTLYTSMANHNFNFLLLLFVRSSIYSLTFLHCRAQKYMLLNIRPLRKYFCRFLFAIIRIQ